MIFQNAKVVKIGIMEPNVGVKKEPADVGRLWSIVSE